MKQQQKKNLISNYLKILLIMEHILFIKLVIMK
jgi:hypothetical protein